MRIAWRHPTPSFWHNELADISRLAAAEAVPDAVVEVQLESGGAIEVAVGGERAASHDRSGGAIEVDVGSSRHAVEAVAGAGGLDGGRPHSATSMASTGSSSTEVSTSLPPSRYKAMAISSINAD
jgi:hypothetical protein